MRAGETDRASAAAEPARLPDDAMRILSKDAKVGLLATVSPDGLPHLTLITSIQPKTASGLMFGQFSEGMSKTHLEDNPHAAFLAMNEAGRWWRGTARWRGKSRAGEDYEAYNRKPMFRYNAYFGIHTVHYLDLTAVEGEFRLTPSRLALAAAAAGLATLVPGMRAARTVLTQWARALLARPTTLKFLAYVGADGYPRIVPGLACAPAGAGRVVCVPTWGGNELGQLVAGRKVALFALDRELRSVLVRGSFGGWRSAIPFHLGGVDLDWVYNSMPPMHGQVYPPVAFEAAPIW